MKLEDIKVGETYNVRVTVKYIDGYDVVAATIRQDEKEGYRTRFDFEDIPAFSPISPETAPKYNPCRMFKKGDIVEPRKGREVYACEWEDCVFHKLEGTYKVCDDEREGHVSVIDKETGVDCYVSSFALELVTPEEELEPYRIFNNERLGAWTVLKNELIFAYYPYRVNESDNIVHSEEEAKAAAEAECERLNTEYRKNHEK